MMHYARVVECWEHAVPLCACVDDCKATLRKCSEHEQLWLRLKNPNINYYLNLIDKDDVL